MKKVSGRLLFWVLWPITWVYAPLKTRVRILVVCGDEFLATKSYFGRGFWELPGGGTKKNETQADTAVRELYEETGVQILQKNITELVPLSVYHESGLSMRYRIFVTQIVAELKTAKPNNEVSNVAWLRLSDTDSLVANHVKTTLSQYNQGRLLK